MGEFIIKLKGIEDVLIVIIILVDKSDCFD